MRILESRPNHAPVQQPEQKQSYFSRFFSKDTTHDEGKTLFSGLFKSSKKKEAEQEKTETAVKTTTKETTKHKRDIHKDESGLFDTFSVVTVAGAILTIAGAALLYLSAVTYNGAPVIPADPHIVGFLGLGLLLPGLYTLAFGLTADFM